MRGNTNEILFPMKCSKFEDAKKVIISCNAENIQYNSQRTNNGRPNTTQKTED